MRVVPGLGATIESFCPSAALRSVDLPTLGRPAMTQRPPRDGAGAAASRSRAGCFFFADFADFADVVRAAAIGEGRV